MLHAHCQTNKCFCCHLRYQYNFTYCCKNRRKYPPWQAGYMFYYNKQGIIYSLGHMLREINMYVPFVPSLCIIIFLLFYYFYLDTRYNISIYFPPTYSGQNIKNPCNRSFAKTWVSASFKTKNKKAVIILRQPNTCLN